MARMANNSLETLRNIPLNSVIPSLWPGAHPASDGGRITQWRFPDGLKVNVLADNQGFVAWTHRVNGQRVNAQGPSQGHGALDLVMAVEGGTFQTALHRLIEGSPSLTRDSAPLPPAPQDSAAFRLPPRDFNSEANWRQVRRYLVEERGLPPWLVREVYEAHQVYAGWGHRAGGFLIFPCRPWDQQTVRPHGPEPTGAILRWAQPGTPPPDKYFGQTHPTAKGSRKDAGWWQIGQGRQCVIATEAPIDALTVYAGLHAMRFAHHVTIVAGGGQGGFTARQWTGFPTVVVATDRDAAGDGFDTTIRSQVTREQTVLRLQPPAGYKDWNEAWRQDVSTMMKTLQGGLQPALTLRRDRDAGLDR
jgi:hypothetical protein|uniref:Toprim domain-containing protein n=1 Tax=Sulfobacillus thermotolerans TaxID=338644 RepID=G5CJ19_9FIRM|nr:toprim domain-containing protein [Sulfobacillus thermotolerans]AEP14296.1 hypothetical protein [Sulfobacillus thermotolerans]